ncbi:MAG: hypothetical protein K2H64_09470 [Desulfovibrio sp.]|nr:hypothetical protein [Desulfovibrio sp.]
MENSDSFREHGALKINPKKAVSRNLLPAKKGADKTMFKLDEECFEFINLLRKLGGESTKEVIDRLVMGAQEDFSSGKIEWVKPRETAVRKSVSISADAKETLGGLAKKHGRSRDEVFNSIISRHLNEVRAPALTSERKINYARILREMASRMEEIYEEPAAKEAREKLLACGDPDLDTGMGSSGFEESLNYIDTGLMNLEITLEEFIAEKEKKCEG